ncbi:uncharacterized protein METZ01_LOCUS275952, partial [marine metagenome]
MRSFIPTCRESLVVVLVVLMSGIAVAQGSGLGIPRTPSGRPDLSGTYDPATLTPLERPKQLGTKLILTEEEAARIAEEERVLMASRNAASDPKREAPAGGGDGSPGAGGNAGGNNLFWIDRGTTAFQIDG